MAGNSDRALGIGSPLSVATLNVNGLNNPKKRESVLRALRREKLDIIALQETFLNAETDYDYLKQRWGGCLHFNAAVSSRSRGVMTLFGPHFKCDSLRVLYKSGDGRILVSSFTYESETFIIVNTYSPCAGDEDKMAHMNNLLDVITPLMGGENESNLICLGDFNVTLSDLDVIAGSGHSRDTVVCFNNFIQSLCVIDSWRLMHPSEKTFTFRRSNPTVARRLDYIFVGELLATSISHSYIKDIGFSDHRLVVTRFEFSTFKFGKGLYKLNISLLSDLNYCRMINSGIDEVVTEYHNVNDHLKWEVLKTNARETSQLYGRFRAKSHYDKAVELQKCLNSLENDFVVSPDNEELVKQITNIKGELEIFEHEKTKGAAIRANIKYIEEGEKCTNYFLALEKCKSKINTIKRLKTESGATILDEKDIVNNIGKHFFKRYNSSTKSEDEISHDFTEFTKNINLPRLSEEESMRLEADITEAELEAAVKSMDRGSAPGKDGLPLEFYIVFWERLKGPLMASIRYCEEVCRLSNTQRTGVLALFLKGSELATECLDNWRPISLLNTDYKIIAKVFSRRTDSVINSIIGRQQTGFVKGRKVSFIHRQIDDMLTLHRHTKRAGILVAIDFKQAFDAINIPYILKCLKLFGFGPRFIKWVEILNTDRQFHVKNGGYISQSFGMHNGVRQGCPLSPQLFIIAAEVLAQKIIQDKHIVGLRPPFSGGTRHDAIFDIVLKILQYADDTSLFLKDVDSLKRAIQVFQSFSKCSDLHLNLNKSFAMSLNGDIIEPVSDLKFQDKIKILGIFYSNTEPASELEINWRKRINNVIKILSQWSKRKLSIIGKLHVIKTFGLSQFVHIMHSISLPERACTEINKIFFRFLWNDNFSNTKPSDKVKRSVVTNNLDEGGLKMIDMCLLQESILLGWAEDLLAPDMYPWKQISLAFFNTLGGKSAFKSKIFYKNVQHINSVSSIFWKSVLITWLKHSGNIRNEYHSYNDPLFNNAFISFQQKPLFFRLCINNGIVRLKDVVENGNVISFDQFEAKRGVNGGAFLEYFAIVQALRPLLRGGGLVHDDYVLFQGTPIGNLGRKFFYEAINVEEEPVAVDYWNRKYDTDIGRHHWQLIHSIRESRLRALAWKVIHNIYPTNTTLHKMKISQTPLCINCNVLDTLEHFFFQCDQVGPLWREIQQKILVDFKTKINLSEKIVLLGPVGIQGISLDTQKKIKHILTVGLLTISKFKYGKRRNIKDVFHFEARLRNL